MSPPPKVPKRRHQKNTPAKKSSPEREDAATATEEPESRIKVDSSVENWLATVDTTKGPRWENLDGRPESDPSAKSNGLSSTTGDEQKPVQKTPPVADRDVPKRQEEVIVPKRPEPDDSTDSDDANDRQLVELLESLHKNPPPIQALLRKAKGHPCTYPGCTSRGSFARKTDLQRHIRTVHKAERFDCKFDWCGRRDEHGFTRRDHYREHLREVHMERHKRRTYSNSNSTPKVEKEPNVKEPNAPEPNAAEQS